MEPRPQNIKGSNKAFIVAAGVLVLVVASAVWHITAMNHLDKDRAAATERVLNLIDMQLELYRAESTQRAYLLSPTPQLRMEYDAVREELVRELERVDPTAFSPMTPAEDVARMKVIAVERADALSSLMHLVETEGHQVALTEFRRGASMAVMERFAVLAGAITDSEIRYLTYIRERTARSNQLLLYLLSGGFALILVIAASNIAGNRRSLGEQRTLTSRAERSGRKISLLNELNNTLLSCSDQTEANRVVPHTMRKLFPDSSGGIYLYRPSRDLLELQTEWGKVHRKVHSTMLSDECWALRRGHSHIRQAPTDISCTHWDAEDVEPGVCVPMMALGETVGMLFVKAGDMDSDEFFDSTNLELVETVASQIASAMANIGLRATLRMQSIKDPLTGLFNRRYMEETLQREIIRVKRHAGVLTVIMGDLDHFKDFNDTHGHQAGDKMLQRFAEEIDNHIRGDDVACRYGGEEFIVIMPGADAAMGERRAEDIRQALKYVRIDMKGGTLPAVTASFGVASIPAHGESVRDVVQQADRALYQAKREGRNRVIVAA